MPFDDTGLRINPRVAADLVALRTARERIVKGWCQHRYTKVQKGVVSVCMLGALGYRDSNTQVRTNPERRLERALPVGGSVPHFNDAPGRTKEEVLAVFDQAIAALVAGQE